jgi:hypothetical protein
MSGVFLDSKMGMTQNVRDSAGLSLVQEFDQGMVEEETKNWFFSNPSYTHT